ncbi:MAG: hypothetical protein ACTSYD_02370 [Candidatus Heimdallarchaeaceae archaeon]
MKKIRILKHKRCGYEWQSRLDRLPRSCPWCKHYLKEEDVEIREITLRDRK